VPAEEGTTDLSGTRGFFRSGALRWWVLGIVCATGLGIFMWAVGGRWNLNAPQPSGPAATPQEAVQKFMAAVDNHDRTLAESYCTPGFVARGQVKKWISDAGYLRFDSAAVVSGAGGETIMRVRYDLATRFLDGDDPIGLNLVALVWTQRLTTLFGAQRSDDGSGWLVSNWGEKP
jgi:hypothetical protein